MTKHKLSVGVDEALKAAGALKLYVMVSGKLQVKKQGGGAYWLTMQEAGTPDRLAVIPMTRQYVAEVDGVERILKIRDIGAIYVEIKDKGDRLQPSQVERIPELIRLGTPVYVCSADHDDSEAAGIVRAAGARWCVGSTALYDRLMEDLN